MHVYRKGFSQNSTSFLDLKTKTKTRNRRKLPQHDKGHILKTQTGFPGGAAVENLPANAGDTGSNPGLGRSHMPRSN